MFCFVAVVVAVTFVLGKPLGVVDGLFGGFFPREMEGVEPSWREIYAGGS